MNILLHPSIDSLYEKYKLDYDDDWGVYIKLRKNRGTIVELIWESIEGTGIWMLKHIEWIGFWHELMILFLIEMYYMKVQTIHLQAVPVETHGGYVNREHLLSFYRRFWFIENPVAQDYRYPHKVPMILENNWKWLLGQVKKYVNSITPQT